MLNFGLTELRLVDPARRLAQSRRPGPAASGADIVLERAQVFDSVAEAVADCAHVYATTVRKRGVTKPVRHARGGRARDPRRRRPHRRSCSAPSARGWKPTMSRSRARSSPCRSIPNSASLNLAQAVILVAYEWSKGEALAQPPETELDPPAPQDELEGMIAQLDAMLEQTRLSSIRPTARRRRGGRCARC